MKKSSAKKKCHSKKSTRVSNHSDKLKLSLITRLNRIEGQVRGVKRLVDADTYCDDILNQVSSIQSALSGFGSLLLEYHLKSCVVDQVREGDMNVIDELMKTMRKLMK